MDVARVMQLTQICSFVRDVHYVALLEVDVVSWHL